ncbi:unnamed protein product [Spirodela intermedia]|uniref:Uncharacterized protein n=1 Tax=Spirodela intermedia TaxID=51605 RepID=A0A7I8IJ32_SPIIN|nr:unnamed protein product [Spirodela intermedia]CAA6657897.1 unnamed protein product [Spirodela intermedia]
MEMDDIHSSKRARVGNGSVGGRDHSNAAVASASKVAQEQRKDEDEEDGDGKSILSPSAAAAVRGLRPWHQHSAASRIYRVARSSGGKDRHSKVMTAKGLRDRRVRLSVSTAIQFYDLQDRLGYDQPSKAIEWLIKAAAAAISELPALDGVFSDQPLSGHRQLEPGDEEKPARAIGDDDDADVSQIQYVSHQLRRHQPEEQQQHFSLTKSTCSSTSETSKGSVLSLSRSEIRVKARERARGRTATANEKDKDTEDDAHMTSAGHHHGLNPSPTPQSSFTELLTGSGGGGHQNQAHYHGPVTVAHANPASNFFQKQLRHQPSAATTTDYFGQVGLLGTGSRPLQPMVFSTQTSFGNSPHMGMTPLNVAAAAAAASATGDHPEMQQHFMQEHFVPYAVTAAGETSSTSPSPPAYLLSIGGPFSPIRHLRCFINTCRGSLLR